MKFNQLEKQNNILSFSILIFAFMGEFLHMPFKGIIHSYYMRNGINTVIYLDDMIYYFTNEFFTLFLVIIIGLKLGTSNASKSILTGICIWFLIEFIEITLQLFGISDARIYINDGSWLQIFTCLTISLLVLFGNRKLTS